MRLENDQKFSNRNIFFAKNEKIIFQKKNLKIQNFRQLAFSPVGIIFEQNFLPFRLREFFDEKFKYLFNVFAVTQSVLILFNFQPVSTGANLKIGGGLADRLAAIETDAESWKSKNKQVSQNLI